MIQSLRTRQYFPFGVAGSETLASFVAANGRSAYNENLRRTLPGTIPEGSSASHDV
jgi:hypothetical protein